MNSMFERQTLHGAYFAIAAYLFWGIAPIYFKALAHVPALEILAHRVVWSVILLGIILYATGQLKSLRVSRQVLMRLVVTASLLSVNWLLFIYAVINSMIIETSLGYFINPLVSVFLGMIFLRERLRPLQWIAILIAGAGIAFQLLYFGAIPWIALSLAFSFGFYGLMRKNLSLPSVTGLMLETLIVLPVALTGLFWFYSIGTLSFGHISWQTDALLILGGFVTSFPLLCFGAAVSRLSLTAAGMFQYIAPSIALIIAVTLYNEPFGIDRMVTFICIWIALILFTIESLHFHRKLAARNISGV